MKRFSQTIRVLLVLLVAVFGNGIVPTASVAAIEELSPADTTVAQETSQPITTEPATDQQGDQPQSDTINPVIPEATPGDGQPSDTELTPPEQTTESVDTEEAPIAQEDEQPVTTRSVENIVLPESDTPVKPDTLDACGTNNDQFVIPVVTNVVYTMSSPDGSVVVSSGYHTSSGQNNIDISASAMPGYVLPKGNYSWTLKFKTTACGENGRQPVTICHRTNAIMNPYVSLTVDADSVDGNAGNDNGQGDHYREHTGPIFDSSMQNGGDWGDIIPPVSGDPGHNGLNWTTVGQTIYANDCKPVTPVPIPEVAPSDPCGPTNAYWQLPLNTPQYTWSLDESGSLIVTATVGTIFSDGTTSHSYGLPEDSNTPCPTEPCPLTPTIVYVTMWLSDSQVMPDAGAYPSGVPGTYAFTVDGLELATPEVESYVTGLIDGGYTKLVDINEMRYSTYRFSDSTGDNRIDPAYVLYVDKDGDMTTTGDRTYLLYEPIYNGTVQEDSWQTWNVINGGNAYWWGDGSGDPDRTWSYFLTQYPNAKVLQFGFNQGTYNQGAHTMVQDIVFGCTTVRFSVVTPPTGSGQVLGTSTTVAPAPRVLTATTLPAELPATGGENNSYVLLGIVVSAATYFIVLRRQHI